ncbi:MAG TPA: ABC transporter ATP-binding protein [Magnetospirillaceae bacterium]|jgi:branched-chain amino acid transport system ATP-binding protein
MSPAAQAAVKVATITAAQPLLDISQVCVRFGGIVALDGVSFSVNEGQIAGLIGPNGAGKTTLFNCLSGLYRPHSGSIRFNGHELNRLPVADIAAAGIGRTFQSPALFDSMTVLDNVKVGAHSRSRSGFIADALRGPGTVREERELGDLAMEMLRLVELKDVAPLPVASLPFGSRKRVELARALASRPKLLLLDEPAGGLNHEEVHSLGALVRAVRDQLGITVLLVEHHMAFVMGLSDTVIALNFGRVITQGTPDQVRADAEVARAYLGSAP